MVPTGGAGLQRGSKSHNCAIVRSTIPFANTIHNPWGHLSESFDGIGNIAVKPARYSIHGEQRGDLSTRRTYITHMHLYVYVLYRRVTLEAPCGHNTSTILPLEPNERTEAGRGERSNGESAGVSENSEVVARGPGACTQDRSRPSGRRAWTQAKGHL
jgi:hypothetical protein